MFPEKHFMERLFTPEIAAFYEKFYADKGVTIKSESMVTALEGEDGEVVSCFGRARVCWHACPVCVALGGRCLACTRSSVMMQ